MLGNAATAPTLPAVDLSRARKFYVGTLGLKVLEENEAGLMLQAGKGTMLFLYQRGPTKADNTAAMFEVENLDQEMKDLRQKGVKFEEYDMPGLKTVNGVAAMGDGRGAWFKDAEGNILAVMERGNGKH